MRKLIAIAFALVAVGAVADVRYWLPRANNLRISAEASAIKRPLPYDAEVEYLQGYQAQYINTMLTVANDTSVEIKLKFPEAIGVPLYVFGGLDGWQNRMFALLVAGYGKPRYGYGNIVYDTSDQTKYYESGTEYTIVMNSNGVQRNGTQVQSFNAATFESSGTFGLFGTGDGGNICNSKLNIYYCKLRKNNVLVADLIPVRVGTEGCMYDRVSGRLFRNAGTGAFTYGADVRVIENHTAMAKGEFN